MRAADAEMGTFKKCFPRSQLYRWIQHLYSLLAFDEVSLRRSRDLLNEYGALDCFTSLKDRLTMAAGMTGEQRIAATWLHIAELWDYVCVREEEAAE